MRLRLLAIGHRPEAVLGAVAMLVTLAFLAASRAGGFIGFPLDDA